MWRARETKKGMTSDLVLMKAEVEWKENAFE